MFYQAYTKRFDYIISSEAKNGCFELGNDFCYFISFLCVFSALYSIEQRHSPFFVGFTWWLFVLSIVHTQSFFNCTVSDRAYVELRLSTKRSFPNASLPKEEKHWSPLILLVK